MLQLRSYKYGSLLSTWYTAFDNNVFTQMDRNFGYVSSIHIYDAMLPLVMNEINLYQATAVWNPSVASEEAFKQIIQYFVEHNQGAIENKVHLNKIYTPDVDKALELLDPDLYINPKAGIQELYNKAMEQSKEREGHTRDVRIAVKLSKVGKEVLIISNYRDSNQMSDMFLTLGLIPVLFSELNHYFNEEEIDYFKSLVARSQVKRISNVKVTEKFNALQTLKKYQDKLITLKLATTIKSAIQRRISNAKYELTRAQDEADSYLSKYNNALSRYINAQKIVDDVEASEDKLFEEYKAALAYDNIVDVSANEASLGIVISTPVEYYNVDEVECFLKNIPQGNFRDFIKDVFIDQKFKLYVIAKFLFNIQDRGGFTAPRALGGTQCKLFNSFYNPHYQYYGCLGDYKPELIKAHNEQDLLMFNNLAIAATKSFNFADGTVMNNFRATLNNYFHNPEDYSYAEYMTAKCLEAEDGTRYSLKDIYIDKVLEQDEEIDEEAVQELEVHDA